MAREHKFKLVDHEVFPVPNVLDWAKWYEAADRRVDQTRVGDKIISTIFLGVDYNFGEGPPILFETAVFLGGSTLRLKRYSTWEQAVEGHAEVVGEEEDAD